MSTSRKHGDSLPKVKGSRAAEASGRKDAEKAAAAGVYVGEVSGRQADGTYSVVISDPKMDLTGVRLALPIFGGMLGVNVNSHLPPDTKVAVAYGRPSFIIARLPDNNPDWKNAKSRSLVDGDEQSAPSGVTADNFSDAPEDLIEGEVEIGNLHGVAIDFLTTIMRLRAGDLAAVECHLINDMVRIISRQFRHISGLGEDLMFDHGRPTMERMWSSYRHEVMGVLDEKQPFADLNGDEVDDASLQEKRILGLGRHRFREFVGFAGDFIHSFISDPPGTIVKLAKGQAAAGAGKSWFHRNSDGSVILQSVSDIRLERVTRIPVPVRVEPHEDPAVTTKRAYDELDSEYLKLPTAINPVDPADAFQAAYHIRTYSRWLARYHSLVRMIQLSDEYEIPSEADTPEPNITNGEADRAKANPKTTYIDTYACMTIMRDGSIVLHDGYGSTIMMCNGNVQVSASRHLDLEAAGDIRLMSGGSIYMKARRNIELSATVGKLIMHAYAGIKALAERGSLWLRSNAVTDKDRTPSDKDDSGIIPEIAGHEAGEEDGFAVLIESAEGGTAVRSDKDMTLAVDGNHPLIVSSAGELDLYGKYKTDLHSRAAVAISSGSDVAIATTTFMSNATKVFIGPTDNPRLVLTDNTLWAHTMKANAVRANDIAGPERGPNTPIPDPDPTRTIKTHYNHIGTLRDPVSDPDPMSDTQIAMLQETIALAQERPETPWDGLPANGPEWSFSDKSEYVWDDREKSKGAIAETLTNQFIRLDESIGEDMWDGSGYEDWQLSSAIEGRRTSSLGGFGHYESQLRASDDGNPLREPSLEAAEHTTEPELKWTAEKLTIKSLKRPE